MNENPLWLDDCVQFPRLIAEIIASGALSGEGGSDVEVEICSSMDLKPAELSELTERAQQRWEELKQRTLADRPIHHAVFDHDTYITEQGNTWLTFPDDDLHQLYLRCPGGREDLWIAIAIRSASHPGFSMRLMNATEGELAQVIRAEFGGWHARKCNIKGVEVTSDGVVVGNDDAERDFSLVTEAVVDALASVIPETFVKFFQTCHEQTGKINPILRFSEALRYLGEPDAKVDMAVDIPHPVHLREGLVVRNVLRTFLVCDEWDTHDYDNLWAEVVHRVLVKKGLIHG